MSNATTTTIDNTPIIIQAEQSDFEDQLVTFTGAKTLLAGTLLARDFNTGKLVPYVVGVTPNGPEFILTYQVTATGAGDIPVFLLARGTVNLSRLVIDADGDASNIDAAHRRMLREVGFVAVHVQPLSA